MGIIIINPQLTMQDTTYEDKFNEEVIKQLRKYGVEFYEISSNNIERYKVILSEKMILLIYNNENELSNATNKVQELLEKAIEKKAEIWPIAIDRSFRKPLKIISEKQSYDVWEQLRCRDLDDHYIGTIAKMFSRKIIARVFPTCYCEEGEIFLSHRRIDGEEITAQIYDKICTQVKESKPFRDVVNVKVGNKAQKVIDNVMENSDVFIFLHTPRSGESDWIIKELRFALLRQIPVLWVQIDNADIGTLTVKPSDRPHLKYRTEDFYDKERLTIIVDCILLKAFELIMDRSNQVLGYLDLMENMFGNKLKIVDKEKMIYHISMERKGYHYPQRNIEQYYQIFGRTPTIYDAKKLNIDLASENIDSVAILTNRIVSSSIRNNVVFDNIQDFCYHWNQYIGKTMEGEKRMEIVISGAFPDSEEIYKQSLTDALILFAKVIIRNGYELTFGAHPTFQELFYEIAREIAPKNYKEKVNMYISEWFLLNESYNEYKDKFNVFISSKKESLNQSLSEMRKNMIQREEVKALICLGGKIKRDKNEEGIREEIELAQKMNIPIFIVGSVGGCSSEVALEYKQRDWKNLNNAPKKLNEQFLEEIDYFNIAQEMINYINSIEK